MTRPGRRVVVAHPDTLAALRQRGLAGRGPAARGSAARGSAQRGGAPNELGQRVPGPRALPAPGNRQGDWPSNRHGTRHDDQPGVHGAEDELTALLLRTLMRAQLSLALRLAAVFGCLLGGLPLLFATVPSTRTVHVLGLPLPWLVLGIAVYPLFVAGGWLYVRLAERNEHDYAEVVGDP